MKKILSIIIPVYNVEMYLKRCLDSILIDRLDEFEVILVDDGSTDNSRFICEEYAKKFSNISILSKKNGGASDARNYAFDEAKGEYIWYIDSDDYITKNAISDILDILKNCECEVIVCQSKKIYENGQCIDECKYTIDRGIYTSYEFMNVLKKNPKSVIFCPQYYIVNKQFIRENSLHFHKGIIYEDELWIPQLLIKAQKIYYTNLNIYYHFMRQESVMHSTKLEKMRLQCIHSSYRIVKNL